MTPEQMQEKILELEELAKTHADTIASMSASSNEDKKRITELQEHNQKLFLRITTKEETKEDDKEPEVPSVEDFAKTIQI